MMQYVKIPKERVAVLIGIEGKIKRKIERETKTKIEIEEGDIEIEGESLGEVTARDICHAIGRGFSPAKAFRLFKEDMVFELIPLMEILSSEKELERKKGRIIGRKGKTRSFIEAITDTNISVYGKSVGLIGRFDDVAAAKDAVMQLLGGARHGAVYKNLERYRAERNDLDLEKIDWE